MRCSGVTLRAATPLRSVVSPGRTCRHSKRKGPRSTRPFGHFQPLERRDLLALVNWDGGGDGTSWHAAANWVGDQLPGANDEAVIPLAFSATMITITANTSVHSIDSKARLSISGATVATGVVIAPELAIQFTSTLTTFPATTTETHKLELNIAGTLTVDDTSKIDVSERGYLPGRTTGNTDQGGAKQGGGGSYGGLGDDTATRMPNAVYGDYADPNDWGSGGASVNAAGGGLVRIAAATLQLEGDLLADGAAAVSAGTGGGSGSGGGIYLDVTTLAGEGMIRAAGGNDYGAGGGGGGRIAVYAEDLTGFNIDSITAPGGKSAFVGAGQPGSIHVVEGHSSTHVRSHSPVGTDDGYFTDALNYIALELNKPIDISTLSTTNLLIRGPSGPIVPTSVEQVGDGLYLVRFPQQTENGRYSFTLLPGVIDAEGFPLDQNSNGIPGEFFLSGMSRIVRTTEPVPDDDVYEFTLIVDTVHPRVTQQSPDGDVAGTISNVDIWFGEAIDATTFTTADVRIVRPDQSTIPAASVQVAGLNRYRISFAPQTGPGDYNVQVGPEIRDLAGNLLDQVRDANPGRPDDIYTTRDSTSWKSIWVSPTLRSHPPPFLPATRLRLRGRAETNPARRSSATGSTPFIYRRMTSGT